MESIILYIDQEIGFWIRVCCTRWFNNFKIQFNRFCIWMKALFSCSQHDNNNNVNITETNVNVNSTNNINNCSITNNINEDNNDNESNKDNDGDANISTVHKRNNSNSHHNTLEEQLIEE